MGKILSKVKRKKGGKKTAGHPSGIIREVPNGPKALKIVLIGDTAVGKSCLIINYLKEQFDENYEPSVLDVFSGSMMFNQKPLELTIHDTSGDSNLNNLRMISYNKADCFMLCVSVANRDSFNNI